MMPKNRQISVPPLSFLCNKYEGHLSDLLATRKEHFTIMLRIYREHVHDILLSSKVHVGTR